MALCLGQLVTHAHIISHFTGHDDLASVHHDHADHHAGSHSHSKKFVDFRTKPSSGQSNGSLLADCGIYHVFVGMYGLAASDRADLSEPSTCEIRSTFPEKHVVSQASDWHLIRGPPTIS